MTQRSQFHIAAISAGITLVVAGAISVAFTFPDFLPPSAGQSEGMELSLTASPKSEAAITGTINEASAPQSVEIPAMPRDVDCAVEKCVALTFDDGPDKDVTPRVLATLRKTGTPATFFHMGKHFAGNEALVKQTLTDGHVVGTHTWDHPQLPLLSREAIEAQILKTKKVSTDITGVTPTLMRPPYGLFNDTVIDVVRASNDAVIMWDVDTEDWKNKNAQITADLAVNNAHRGAIILMHDVHPTTADALPQVIDRLRAQGYTLVTIPQLLGEIPAGTIHYSGDLDE